MTSAMIQDLEKHGVLKVGFDRAPPAGQTSMKWSSSATSSSPAFVFHSTRHCGDFSPTQGLPSPNDADIVPSAEPVHVAREDVPVGAQRRRVRTRLPLSFPTEDRNVWTTEGQSTEAEP